jgi:hypothetical protein
MPLEVMTHDLSLLMTHEEAGGEPRERHIAPEEDTARRIRPFLR